MRSGPILFLLLGPLANVFAAEAVCKELPTSSGRVSAAEDFVSMGDQAGNIQFRLYTNASPHAPRLLNTFDLEAYGTAILQAPQNIASSIPSLHSMLIDGQGPNPGPTNQMRVLERATGPEWSYIELDGTGAYQDRLKEYRRGILFIEPGLVVLYDHLVAREPVEFRMLLHPPAETVLDPVWHDLRFKSSSLGFRIHVPSGRGALRSWERLHCAADEVLDGTVTMAVGPTNKVTQLDVLTIFAAYPERRKDSYYAFKLLESNDAIGARIHRNGLPTLVAFRTSRDGEQASLTGFRFKGPVGVDVFKPKQHR